MFHRQFHDLTFLGGGTILDVCRANNQTICRSAEHDAASQLDDELANRSAEQLRRIGCDPAIASGRQLHQSTIRRGRRHTFECRWTDRLVDRHQFPVGGGIGGNALPSRTTPIPSHGKA